MVGFWLWGNVHNKPDTGSSRIRGKWLINHWPEAEELHYGRKYEAIIYQKVYEVEHAKIFNGVKILDVCDPDYLDCKIPFMEMVEACDLVTTSTDNLRDVIQGWTDKPVITINDRHDLDFFKEKKLHRGRAKEVCWFGYSHNAGPLKAVLPYLFDNQLKLSIIADNPVDITSSLPDKRVEERFTKWQLNTINKEIIKSDFIVMPGSRDPNSRFKSNNKTIHSYLLKMPVASSIEELERYIDPKNRELDSEKNYEMAKKLYDVKVSVREMKNLIDIIKQKKLDKTK